MGRHLPPSEGITSSHPTLLSLAIFVTWIAAFVAAVSGLCGIWSKKRSKSTKKVTEDDDMNIAKIQITTTAATATATTAAENGNNSRASQAQSTNSLENNDEEVISKPLPPPPSATKLEFGEPTTVGNKKGKKAKNMDKSYSTLNNYMSKDKTKRKILSSSLSMKVMSMHKIKDKASDFKDKASEFKDKASEIKDKASDFGHRKPKDSDSLWTKRIILGEKCRLPNDDNDQETITIASDDQQENIGTVDARSYRYTRTLSRTTSLIVRDSGSFLNEEEKIKDKGKGKEIKVHSDDEDDS